MPKYVKDEARNRYEAYCCDDIDARVGALEAAVEALVAGTVPDGAITLPKLANDARTWTRELNKGLLVAEWIGTKDEYNDHIALNGGEPQANVRYTIIDEPYPAPQHEYNKEAATKLPSAGYYIINYYIVGYGYYYTTGIFYWDGKNQTYFPPVWNPYEKKFIYPFIERDGYFAYSQDESLTNKNYSKSLAVLKIG